MKRWAECYKPEFRKKLLKTMPKWVLPCVADEMDSDYLKNKPTVFGKTKLESFAPVFAAVYCTIMILICYSAGDFKSPAEYAYK